MEKQPETQAAADLKIKEAAQKIMELQNQVRHLEEENKHLRQKLEQAAKYKSQEKRRAPVSAPQTETRKESVLHQIKVENSEEMHAPSEVERTTDVPPDLHKDHEEDTGSHAVQQTGPSLDSQILRGFVLYEPLKLPDRADRCFKILQRSAILNKASLRYKLYQEGAAFRCVADLNGVSVAEVHSSSKTSAQFKAATEAVALLRKYCWTLHRKSAVPKLEENSAANPVTGGDPRQGPCENTRQGQLEDHYSRMPCEDHGQVPCQDPREDPSSSVDDQVPCGDPRALPFEDPQVPGQIPGPMIGNHRCENLTGDLETHSSIVNIENGFQESDTVRAVCKNLKTLLGQLSSSAVGSSYSGKTQKREVEPDNGIDCDTRPKKLKMFVQAGDKNAEDEEVLASVNKTRDDSCVLAPNSILQTRMITYAELGCTGVTESFPRVNIAPDFEQKAQTLLKDYSRTAPDYNLIFSGFTGPERGIIHKICGREKLKLRGNKTCIMVSRANLSPPLPPEGTKKFVSREDLGLCSSERKGQLAPDFQECAGTFLENYWITPYASELIFDSSFSGREREIIHKICARLRLRHDSVQTSSGQQISVSLRVNPLMLTLPSARLRGGRCEHKRVKCSTSASVTSGSSYSGEGMAVCQGAVSDGQRSSTKPVSFISGPRCRASEVSGCVPDDGGSQGNTSSNPLLPLTQSISNPLSPTLPSTHLSERQHGAERINGNAPCYVNIPQESGVVNVPVVPCSNPPMLTPPSAQLRGGRCEHRRANVLSEDVDRPYDPHAPSGAIPLPPSAPYQPHPLSAMQESETKPLTPSLPYSPHARSAGHSEAGPFAQALPHQLHALPAVQSETGPFPPTVSHLLHAPSLLQPETHPLTPLAPFAQQSGGNCRARWPKPDQGIVTREYLGLSPGYSAVDFLQCVKSLLQDYNEMLIGDDGLVFSASFSGPERDIVHRLCERLTLNHQNRGMGKKRHVVVAHRRSRSDLLNHVRLNGNETRLYKAIPPPM